MYVLISLAFICVCIYACLCVRPSSDAVDFLLSLLNMCPVTDTKEVVAGSRSYAMNLCGSFLGDAPAFARAGFMVDPKNNVTLKARREIIETEKHRDRQRKTETERGERGGGITEKDSHAFFISSACLVANYT